jgi:hypothetical protein
MDVQFFEKSFGSLVVVVLFFSSFFVYERKRTLLGVLFGLS